MKSIETTQTAAGELDLAELLAPMIEIRLFEEEIQRAFTENLVRGSTHLCSGQEGVAVGACTNAEARAAWEQVLVLMARQGARPLVDSVFPFEELPKAFKRLAEGPMGKVLLQVAK